MSPRRTTRPKVFVLTLASVAALAVVGFVIGDWPALMAHFHAWRIERAESYEAALPWLEEINASGKDPRAASAFVNAIRKGRERLTVWFFIWLEHSREPAPELVATFRKRLERDETLLASWSQYVRWRLGASLWSYLNSLSPEAESPEEDDRGPIYFPCGVGFEERVVLTGTQGIRLFPVLDAKPDSYKNLRTLGIAWFVGMWPLPAGENPEAELTSWMQTLRPFSRHAVYDERLGRCKRDSELAPLPELGVFSGNGLTVPSKPLPAWDGPPPALPQTAEIFDPSHIDITPSKLKAKSLR